MSFSKILYRTYLTVLLIIPIALLILPANFFDEGQSICLSVLLLDKSCYACGMTRAMQHLIHLDFSTAWEFNKLAFVVFPLLSFSYLKEIKRVFSKC